jgi:glycosyltransferase involved in cell wall biosynthesis
VVGDAARVVRVGLPMAAFRQMWWLPAARRLRQLARGVDLVHAHLAEDLAVVPLALAAARGRVPLVVTVHTSLRHTLPVTGPRSVVLKSVGALLEQVGERRAAAVLALTPRLAQLLGDHGVDSDRIHVVPSGVQPALFAADHHDPFPHVGRPRVVFVGRLAPQKGVHMLVRAAAQLRTPEAQVVVVGDGPNRARIENEIERLGLRRRVHVTGFVPHDQVPAVLAHADVFVMPSVYEELGSALVEAQWAGLPIVATRVGGIPDVVDDGATGVLVPPGDPTALARAVDDLLSDPRRARTLARRGQAAATRYDWTRLGAQVLDVYETVTDQRTTTTRPYHPPTRPTPHDAAPPAPTQPPAAAR